MEIGKGWIDKEGADCRPMLHASEPEPLIGSSHLDMTPPKVFDNFISVDIPFCAFLRPADTIDKAGEPAQHVKQLVRNLISDVEPDDDFSGSTIVGKGFNGGIGKAEDGGTPH